MVLAHPEKASQLKIKPNQNTTKQISVCLEKAEYQELQSPKIHRKQGIKHLIAVKRGLARDWEGFPVDISLHSCLSLTLPVCLSALGNNPMNH